MMLMTPLLAAELFAVVLAKKMHFMNQEILAWFGYILIAEFSIAGSALKILIALFCLAPFVVRMRTRPVAQNIMRAGFVVPVLLQAYLNFGG